MIYRRLGRTDIDVSILGFGASSLGGVFRPVNEGDAIRTVAVSLDAGINFIDVAPYYGLTKAETVLGKALRGVGRDRYILSTKVGRYGPDIADCDYSAKRVKRSVDESLTRLGVEHVDLIQVHDVEFGDLDQIITQTLPALREVVASGKARYVGVTGLPISSLRYVIEQVPVDVILSYCHYELNDTALLDLIPLLEEKGIGVISASPLGMGLLSGHPAPDWHPAPESLKAATQSAAQHCRARGASIEKLAIQFALREHRIGTTLVGSADPQEMLNNIAAIEEPLDEQLLAEVLEILQPVHNLTWPSGLATRK